MRLKFVLAAFGIVAVLAASGIFAAISFYEMHEIKKEHAVLHLNGLALDKSKDISDFLGMLMDRLESLSRNHYLLDFVKSYETANLSKEQQQLAIELLSQEGRNAAILDKSNIVIASAHFTHGANYSAILKSSHDISHNGEFSFYIYYNEKERKDFLAIDTHIESETGEEIGHIVFDIPLAELEQITSIGKSPHYKYYRDRAYVINHDLLLLTPVKTPYSSVRNLLVQKVDSENSRKCLERASKFTPEELLLHDTQIGGVEYMDFMGEKVLGTHKVINGTGWCVLAEMDVADIYNAKEEKESIIRKIYIGLALALFAGFSGFVLGSYLRRHYLGSIHGNSGKYKKMDDTEGNEGCIMALSKMPLHAYFGLGLLFAIAYFFFVTYFFQGWQNAKFFDDIPDLAFFIISFVIFGMSFRLRNYFARSNVAIGAFFLCVWKLIEVVLQEYQAVAGVLGAEYWFLAIINAFIGFSFLFIGFKEAIK